MTSDYGLHTVELPDNASEQDNDWCSALDIFADLSTDHLKLFENAQECVSYTAGDSVVASGQHDGTLLYGIANGIARIVRPAVQVGDFDVREAGEGDVIGLAECLAFREPMPSSMAVTALTDIDVVLLDRDLLLRILTDKPAIMAHFLSFTARHWLAATAPGEADSHVSTRIHRHLASLAERDGDVFVIAEMPRHAQLAEECGVTGRDAAATIATLIDKGIVRRDYPSLVIENIAALRASAF